MHLSVFFRGQSMYRISWICLLFIQVYEFGIRFDDNGAEATQHDFFYLKIQLPVDPLKLIGWNIYHS